MTDYKITIPAPAIRAALHFAGRVTRTRPVPTYLPTGA
jgi:hypothetical protein